MRNEGVQKDADDMYWSRTVVKAVPLSFNFDVGLKKMYFRFRSLQPN